MNPTWPLARDASKAHVCTYEGCNAAFNRPFKLQSHLLVHANVRAFTCSEENCNKAYTTKSHLDRHISATHRTNQRDLIIFSCPSCMNLFANLQNLKRHISRVHLSNRAKFSCAICGREFYKKHQLNTHMFQHTGIKAFSCDECSESFVTPLDKKRHMKFHKTYSCTECFLKFNHWSLLQKHRKAAHIPKEYKCEHCGRVFKQRSYIVHHMKTHYPRQICSPDMVYLCPHDGCDRQYTMKKNLKQHIKINHDKITHDCTVCQAKLCTKAKLNQHMKLHQRTEVKRTQPKTLATGRRVRRDKGTARLDTALKISGISPEFLRSALLVEMVESPGNGETVNAGNTANGEAGNPDRNEVADVEVAC